VELESRADPHTQRFELEPGEIAMPGLVDAHAHVIDAALAADAVDLTTAGTLEAGLRLVATAAARIREPGWITGAGWDQRRWDGWPTAEALERVAPGRLVALRSVDHHSLWASHAALRAAGIDGHTPDPAGGVIGRSSDGTADGLLLENAVGLVSRHVPPPGAETVRRAVRSYARELLALGLVGAHDPASLASDAANAAFDAYADLAEAGDLPIRIRACIREDGLGNAIERGLRSGGPIGRIAADRLSMGWLKLFADGTLGSRTAALLEPIEGTTERGILTTPAEELVALATRAADAGIATQIHTIGDAAVRTALDALGSTVPRVSLMPRLEHVQLCDPVDRSRFAKLGIAASVQPIHLRSDAATARQDWGERAERAGYAWRSLLEAGAIMAFGTDAPVEPIDPWPGIALAVLRRDPSWGPEAEPFGAQEALTLEQALRAATVGAAATAKDPVGGRLVPGSPADLIVLPAAPRESTDAAERAAAFATVRPRIVMIGGEVVLER
jgi:predicted amidohydrolase YtcJ